MKKIFISSIILITIGFLIGKLIFMEDKNIFKSNNNTYYFLLEGIYSDKDNLENNSKKLSNKIIDYQDNKYYVYVGITRDLEVAKKLENIYENKGYQIYKKEKDVISEEFSTNVEQFDLLIKENNDTDQILTIEEVVLANYEEIVKKH